MYICHNACWMDPAACSCDICKVFDIEVSKNSTCVTLIEIYSKSNFIIGQKIKRPAVLSLNQHSFSGNCLHALC